MGIKMNSVMALVVGRYSAVFAFDNNADASKAAPRQEGCNAYQEMIDGRENEILRLGGACQSCSTSVRGGP